MELFWKKGRSDIDAWAKVMIQGYKKGMPIDKAVLEQATDQSIRNDCRIIRESVQIVMRSSDYEVVADMDELRKLVSEYGKIGSNLNQIARYFNTGGEFFGF